jgi:uncharacterized protein
LNKFSTKYHRTAAASAVAAVLNMVLSGTAPAASFDCAKAKSKIERAICADAELSNLDEYLGRYFAGALETAKDAASCVKADQKAWVKRARDACGAKSGCLTQAYLERLSTLSGLQPGMNLIEIVDLPRAPTLMAVIPPEADFSPSKAKKPFELTGELVWEQGDQMNMGYAVKPDNGQARAFVLDMSIGNSPAHELVKFFIDRSSKPQYRVRGMKDDAADGFATGECRFVYEMP